MYPYPCAPAAAAVRPTPLPGTLLPAAIPPLPEIERTPPALRVALPDGSQAQLPGFLWPNPDVWSLADLTRTGPPPISIRQVKRKQSNVLTGAWHDLGAETRLFSYTAFILYVLDEAVAVATAGTTVSASIESSVGLTRLNTIELTRICRSDAPRARGVLRAMLRLWRDFLARQYWTWRTDVEKRALVTYSLPGKRGGNLYRFDGWVRLRGCRPWHGQGTWQSGSRAGTPEGLWAYWLPDGIPPAPPSDTAAGAERRRAGRCG
jgi:hypothetical protein